MWEEADISWFEVPMYDLPKVTEETHTYLYQGSPCPREVWSWYLRNTSQKCEWAKLLDRFLSKGMRLRCLTVGFLPTRPRFSTRVMWDVWLRWHRQFSPEGLNFTLPIKNLQHSTLTSPGVCTKGLREVTVPRDLVSPDTQLIKSQEKNYACP
jgi:hypothetical protein